MERLDYIWLVGALVRLIMWISLKETSVTGKKPNLLAFVYVDTVAVQTFFVFCANFFALRVTNLALNRLLV